MNVDESPAAADLQRVTVLLPVRNGMPLLPAALTSCLDDLRDDDRILVLENNSTDRTAEYVAQVADADPRVRLIRTGARSLPEALNAGIGLATTQLLARMDADDITLPGRFEAQRRAFAARPELVLCGTQIKRFVHDPDRSESVSRHPLDHASIVSGLLRSRHVMTHASVMFSKTAADQIGGYWTHGLSEDCDFFLRLSRRGQICNLPDVGYAVRFHGASANATHQMEILLGMRFAAHRYSAGDADQLDYGQFREAMMSNPWRRWKIKLEAVSDNLYRSSQIRLLESRRSAIGLLQLGGAGLLRMDKTVDRVLRSVSSRE